MKRAFTLIELVFVIVVFGIISMFGADLYTQIYRSYVHTRALNQLEARTQNAITLISGRLEDRIKGTVIGRIASKPLATNFTDLSSITADHDIIEWIGQSVETKNLGGAIPGWSGFIDLNSVPAAANLGGAFTINTQGSLLTGVNAVLANLRSGSPSANNGTFGVIFKSTTGDLTANVGPFYGYANDGQRILVATANADNANREILNITNYPANAIGDREFSEQYYAAHTAYSILPITPVGQTDLLFTPTPNPIDKNFDLQLRYNYQPWESEQYNGAAPMRALIAQDVSLFRFRYDNGAVALKLCMRDNGRNLDPVQFDLIVCKSQVVY